MAHKSGTAAAADWEVVETVFVSCDCRQAYDYLAQFENIAQWDPSVAHAQQIDFPGSRVGGRYRIVLRFAGKKLPMDYEITVAQPFSRLTLVGRGDGFMAEDRIRFRPLNGGTEIVYAAKVAFDRPPSGWTAAIGRRLFAVNARRAIRRLQRLLGGPLRPLRLTAATRMFDRMLLPALFGFTRWGAQMARRRHAFALTLLAGKKIVITGATSGIGLATATQLVRLGAAIIIVGRNQSKLEQVKSALESMDARAQVKTERADLGRMHEIVAVAGRIRAKHGAIDVLINNAGALFRQYEKTAEGIEKTLATDLLGPYLLTRELLPALSAASKARVINVASGGMYTQGIQVDRLTCLRPDYDGPTAYARAKRGLVLLSQTWARQWAPLGICVHAMHPGWVATAGLRRSLPAFQRMMRPFLRSALQGADTIVWLAGAPHAGQTSGLFWLDRKPRSMHVFGHTRRTTCRGEELITALDRLVRVQSSIAGTGDHHL